MARPAIFRCVATQTRPSYVLYAHRLCVWLADLATGIFTAAGNTPLAVARAKPKAHTTKEKSHKTLAAASLAIIYLIIFSVKKDQ
jgi:hypothetical protein